MAHEEEHCRQAGFDDFISKPFRFEIIRGCLRRLLQVEFEYAQPGASARAAASLPALEKLRLPQGLRERLQAAAKEAGVTRLKKGIEELEALGAEGAALAETMRQAVREYDMEGILAMLKRMEPHSRTPGPALAAG
jgi:CheY-like chemotaxis protein